MIEEAAFAPAHASGLEAQGVRAMTSATSRHDGVPAAEVRAQVQRMTASDVFASSPQLAAFLVFVVEAVLRGHGERLKGYTIGVEVLRRDVNFDPQIDPIVRVEATRLRRAIERYYAGPGADDPVVIGLPRGGYVPRISLRVEAGAVSAPTSAEEVALAPGNGLPTLYVAPLAIVGTPDTQVVAPESLDAKIAEAFALFDGANIIAPASAAPAARSDYRLDSMAEYRGNGSVDLRFKLTDESDATVIWSRVFEKLSGEDGDAERRVVLELGNTLVQPYGVTFANDRVKRFAALDPRYRALLDAADVLRSFDPAGHVRARGRLEQLIAIDPNFANGFALLAVFHAREHSATPQGTDLRTDNDGPTTRGQTRASYRR